jgi:hypothetical protein
MPLNTNIALGFQAPQIESPVNAMLRMSQLEAANQESQLNALRARGIETTMREEENFRNALRGGGDYNDPEVQRKLLAANPARAIDLFKNVTDRKKAAADAQRIETETADKTLGIYRSMLPGIQTPQEMAEWYRHQYDNPLLVNTPVRAHSLEAKIAAIPTDPAKFAEFKAQVEMGMDKYFTVNRGIATTPGGAVQSPFKYGVQTPPNLEAKQPATDLSIVPGAPGANSLAVQVKPGVAGGPPQVSATPIPGTAKPTQAETLDVKDIAERNKKYVGAKTAVDTFETKAAEHVRNLKKLADHPGLNGITGLLYGRTPSVTGNARAAEVLFDKVTASDVLELIMDMKRQSPTGASPLGQFTDSDRETVKSTTGFSRILDAKDLRDELLNAAAKMEGVAKRARQAFSETYSYKQGTAAGATPDTTPTTPDTTPAKDPYANLPRVTNNDDYRKLPSGTEFIGPDNTRRRKP